MATPTSSKNKKKVAPPYDITAGIRRFKDRRAHISAYDTVMLAEAQGLPDARTLPYERLTRAIRRKIERS